MMRKTHIAIGCLVTSIVLINTKVQPIAVVGILGATFPDIDLKLGIKHRTITHSILLLILTSILISLFNIDVALVWFVNYLSHLISDSCTKSGVPFFYPFIKRKYGLRLIKTGGSIDYFTTIVCIYIICEIWM